MILFAAVLLCINTVQGKWDCNPGMSCYPTTMEFQNLDNTLEGDIYSSGDGEYTAIVKMKNTRVTKYPMYIVVVKSTTDIQKTVLFAREKNLKVVVQSSGHDFQGRSTANGAFMIYLGKMTNIVVNKTKTDREPAGEIILESGNQWIRVYEKADNYSRVVVGGSAHTVAIGGWTLGGGHSPISGVAGLGVDNLLEAEMVAADGSIVIADDSSTRITYPNGTTSTSSNVDLFWALRGGGGGTYGIVTQFTFRMHNPPPAMVRFSCEYPIIHANGTYVGNTVIRKYADMVLNMPGVWGGYMLVSATHKTWTNIIYPDGSVGSLSFFMNHFGNFDTESRRYMDQMMNFGGIARHCSYKNVSTFLQYEVEAIDPLYIRNVIIGTLMQANSFSEAWIEYLIDFALAAYRNNWYLTTSFTGILLGGKVLEVGINDTSVHPGWRTALMSTAYGISWGNDDGSKYDSYFLDYINKQQNKLYTFGNGMYPNEAGGNVPAWQNHFWGANYAKLSAIKEVWDPELFFDCLECVKETTAGTSSAPSFTLGTSSAPSVTLVTSSAPSFKLMCVPVIVIISVFNAMELLK